MFHYICKKDTQNGIGNYPGPCGRVMRRMSRSLRKASCIACSTKNVSQEEEAVQQHGAKKGLYCLPLLTKAIP